MRGRTLGHRNAIRKFAKRNAFTICNKKYFEVMHHLFSKIFLLKLIVQSAILLT